MVLSLDNLKLCAESCLVQGCGNLTDTAADAVYHTSVLISRCRKISVFFGKRMHTLITGQSFPRHQYMSVDFCCSVLQVACPGSPAAAEICRKASQLVLYGGQLFFPDLCFLHSDSRLYSYFLCICICQCCLQSRLCGLCINRLSIHFRRNFKPAVNSGNCRILRLCRHSLAVGIHKLSKFCSVHTCFQRKVNRLLFQVLSFHVLLDQISACPVRCRFLHCLRICPGKSQLSCSGLHRRPLDG